LLSRQLAQFGEIQLPQDLEPEQVQAYQLAKGQLQQAIQKRQQDIELLKSQRKALPKYILVKDLPEQDRFQQLRAEKKHFLDTVKLIAYRAETALAQLARDKMHRLDDARSLIRQLFRTEVDLIPDPQKLFFPPPICGSFTKLPAHANSMVSGCLRLRRAARPGWRHFCL
jgi:hypothetical protein